ncbi:MAG TPA: hypothetical protein VL172_21025 [Kofleriaceae bacterium]|jgi:type II secretory pathway pseudopilin PulG|nr:hypothetical protein [Kofleriaceae bacterium]
MNCTKCGKPATFVQQYGQWWCEDCKGYIPPVPPPPAKSHTGLILGLTLGIGGGILVLGILAAVAIPSFLSYSKKSKSHQVQVNLDQIYKGARTYQFANAVVLTGKVGPTPALGDCCNNGGKCAPDSALWNDPMWEKLEFRVDRPDYYSYEYQGDDKGFTVRAYGDLDCDSVMSTFEMTATFEDGIFTRGPMREVMPNE